MKLTKRISCFFEDTLPQGMTEFNLFIDDVAELSGLPKNEKLRKVTAQFILMLPPTVCKYSKWRLANQLKKAAANQVASEVMRIADENEKQTKEGSAKEPNSQVGQEAC